MDARSTRGVGNQGGLPWSDRGRRRSRPRSSLRGGFWWLHSRIVQANPSLDNLGLMAADWITRGLAQTGMVEAVSSITAVSSARFVAEESSSASERQKVAALAEDTGAGTVITGAFYLQGEEILISAEVTDTVSMQLLSALEPARAPIETPLGAVEKLQSRITAAVAAHLDAAPCLARQAFSAARLRGLQRVLPRARAVHPDGLSRCRRALEAGQ